MPSMLFQDLAVPTYRTEGIKYAGSKRLLIPHILELARRVRPKSVFDGFSGSTRVTQAFAQSGYRVISNDIAVWSEVFGRCYLFGQKSRRDLSALIKHLNSLPGKDGWFTEHYGGEPVRIGENAVKKPWQMHNTRKLDAIREEIDALALPEPDRSIALTSLILALDKVESTLGHFAAYLRDWAGRSYNPLYLEMPVCCSAAKDHEVSRRDIFDALDNYEADLAYLDPPYGSNNDKMPPSRVRYAAYYHIWTTICLNDRPKLFGKVGRRADSSDKISASVFEEFRRGDDGRFIVVAAIERMLKAVRAKHIILSYSTGGRATAKELTDVLSTVGHVLDVMVLDHKKHVMANMKWTNEWLREVDVPNQEMLFLIEK